jgi:hypothetical protein
MATQLTGITSADVSRESCVNPERETGAMLAGK